MTGPFVNSTLHRELFRVTDRLRKLKNNPQDVTLGEYNEILRDLCGSLTTSLEHGLATAIFSSNANDPTVQAQARAIAGDLNAFAVFLEFEKSVLVRCGVSPDTAEDIVAELRPLRTLLRDFEYDPKGVMEIVQRLRDESCQAAGQAKRYLLSEEQLFDDKKRALIGYGAATILANGSIVAITLGAAAPIAALSAGGGGLLITWRGIMEAPKDRKPVKP